MTTISSAHFGSTKACQSAIQALSHNRHGRRTAFVERGSSFRAIRWLHANEPWLMKGARI